MDPQIESVIITLNTGTQATLSGEDLAMLWGYIHGSHADLDRLAGLIQFVETQKAELLGKL